MTPPAFAQDGTAPLNVLYVPNKESHTVSVIDTDTNQVINVIDLLALTGNQTGPVSVVATPDGKKAYGKHTYRFRGTIDGVRVHADLKAPKPKKSGSKGSSKPQLWSFKFKGKDADSLHVENPVDTSLQIGDDAGRQPYNTRIKG